MLLEFENKLASFIEEHDLFDSVAKVVLAVSGGADSTALLYAMLALKAEKILKIQFVCAHINHRLRGVEADLDEKFVVAEASKLKLDVTTKRVDVRGFARDHKLSIETAARQCRIKALVDIAKANRCERIVTAHQKNDNAETVLHRLIRGTGFRGLAGIWPKRIFADGVTFLRPMLGVTREEVIEYVQTRNLTWRRDRTNNDCTYRRNFIRHRLLPALQRECRDSVVETLSDLARSSHRFCRQICKRADEIWPSMTEYSAERTTLDLKKFLSEPPPVRVELIRRSLTHIGCGQRAMTRLHFERIVQLAGQDITGKRIELPNGFIVRREYGNMVFSWESVEPYQVDLRPLVELKVPGKTPFGQHLIEAVIYRTQDTDAGFLSCHFDRKSTGGLEQRNLPSDKRQLSYPTRCLDYARHDSGIYVERFDLEKVNLPLSVRSRRPGDRFVPLGMGGEKKIGKFLTAQHVPHDVREKVVLVEDREQILWVWPVRISEQAKITNTTRHILQLQIMDSSDP
jgi:tRNA(Ile)-lysidine synthase